MRKIYSLTKPPLGALINFAHPLARGLIAYWAMLEGMGNKVYDLSGNKNTGTLIGMADPSTPTSGWNPGKFGKCLAFEGTHAASADYISIPDSDVIEFGSNNFTIVLWILINSVVRQSFFHWSDTSDWSFGLDYNSVATNKLGLWGSSTGSNWDMINADAGGSGIGSITFPQNRLVPVMIVRNGNTWSIYQNSIVDISISASGTLVNKANTKVIGKWWDVNQCPLNGKVEVMSIYKRALSAGEGWQLCKEPFCIFNQ